MKEVLLSFVGKNDFNKEDDGAVLTVFKRRKFNEVHLLWNPSRELNFFEVAQFVKAKIIKRKYCNKIILHPFDCDDVTDHNEIYPKLLELCNCLKLKGNNFTAAISSGTPSMQACWILLAESGDFPLKLIRSNEAKFGKAIVREVKLDTSLPRIMRLKEENEELKKENRKLLLHVSLNILKAAITIGKEELNLSPVEFAYYRYFIERALNEKEYLRIDIDTVPEEFFKSVITFHRDSFPQADSNRVFSEKNKFISSPTFRSNVSKLNKKIVAMFDHNSISKYYIIEAEGKRYRKSYGVNLPKEKIRIIK